MESRHTLLGRSMKENKLGRKFANTWSPPRNRFATRMANKGVRKNAKLMIKAGEEESEGGRSNFHASVTSLLHGEVCNLDKQSDCKSDVE